MGRMEEEALVFVGGVAFLDMFSMVLECVFSIESDCGCGCGCCGCFDVTIGVVF